MRVPFSFCLLVLFVALPGLCQAPSEAEYLSSSRTDAKPVQASPSFAVVRIKVSPNSESNDWGMGLRGRNFWAVHVTFNELVGWAYGLNARQIEHAPEWLARDRFDVDGIPEEDTAPSINEYRTMLQGVLVDRFALKYASAERLLPVYSLSVATGGVKILASSDTNARASWGVHRGWFSVKNMTLESVAGVLQRTVFDRPVLDHTGLHGKYSFVLRWRADDSQFSQMQDVDVPQEQGTDDTEDIYTSARQQLGIQIEARKELAPTMTIESVSHPSAN